MKKQMLAAAMGLALALPGVLYAGPDHTQDQMISMLQQASKKLEQARGAKGAERDKLMTEHVKLMEEVTGKMQGMRPAAGLTPKQQQEWYDEHAKIMAQLVKETRAVVDFYRSTGGRPPQ